MFGHDLNKTQIAQLVKDIVEGADINEDGDIGKTRTLLSLLSLAVLSNRRIRSIFTKRRM